MIISSIALNKKLRQSKSIKRIIQIKRGSIDDYDHLSKPTDRKGCELS